MYMHVFLFVLLGGTVCVHHHCFNFLSGTMHHLDLHNVPVVCSCEKTGKNLSNGGAQTLHMQRKALLLLESALFKTFFLCWCPLHLFRMKIFEDKTNRLFIFSNHSAIMPTEILYSRNILQALTRKSPA